MGPGFESQRDHKVTSIEVTFLIMAYCYILYSARLNKYYIGACIDVNRRFREHNNGHSTFTKTGIPWELKYKEEFADLPAAKRREAGIKKMKSRLYIERLISS